MRYSYVTATGNGMPALVGKHFYSSRLQYYQNNRYLLTLTKKGRGERMGLYH
jgi:hypothetical protein